MHMAATSSNASKHVLIDAIVGRKTANPESLNELIGNWIDAVITTDGAGEQAQDQKLTLINYARHYFEAAKLIAGSTEKVDLDGGIKSKLDPVLGELSQEITETTFKHCQEIFNQAIAKLPHANHEELIDSSSKLADIFIKEHKPAESSISLTDFKAGLEKADDVTQYFENTISQLSKEDFAILKEHFGAIKAITSLNPGLGAIRYAKDKNQIKAFLQAASKAAIKSDKPLEQKAKTELFQKAQAVIEEMMTEGKTLMKRNPNFNLESFYTGKLKILEIPSIEMQEIIDTVKTNIKEDDPEANNDTKDFFSNIAQELMESVPYLAIQAVMGFCSSLLHYIPFVGGTAASILNTTTQVLSSRCMGKAMQSTQKAPPAPTKAA